jgi:RNA polymerase sigma-70 factor (ECF subfamily)
MIRVEGGRVLATLVRLTGDFQLAEDALQEAVLVALQKWPQTGVPANPAGWLTTAARNKALDQIRRESRRSAKEEEAVRLLDGGPVEPPDGRDDRLRLLFTVCHPALSLDARVALALRTIGGLTTTEIARAFLVPEPTMGQRISRAKQKIKSAHIPYRVPEDHELPDRLPGVLGAIYVVFTTGHHAPSGRLDSRVDLSVEAVRLARLLFELMPDVNECAGLLALLLATQARHRTRLDESGGLVLLADQDRSQWDRAAISEAKALLDGALRRRSVGPYQIQAAIACLHSAAESYAATDWEQIVELYRRLEHHFPTGVVRVNRAVAEAELSGAQRGLELLVTVEGAERWHLWWSAKADFLRRLDRLEEAGDAYRRALACDMNDTDRRFLEGRLETLGDSPSSAS